MSDIDGITYSDIKNVINILEVASSRGAFKVEEYSSIGSIVDKFRAVMAHIESEVEYSGEQFNYDGNDKSTDSDESEGSGVGTEISPE